MGLKQKVVFGSGITNTVNIYETVGKVNQNDQGGKFVTAPKGPYSISESINLVFTNKIVGRNSKNINIADGERRPGHK
jgi:hypothetical protein